MNNCKSFKPSIDANSKVLILGSIPGVKSLEEQQYYAHPQNRFWKVLGRICNTDNLQELSYSQKLTILLHNGIALWDTIKSCKREGSLDSDIQNENPNDIKNLLKTKRRVSFFELSPVVSKEYVVATFLAVLEMAKEKEITITQKDTFDDIICEVI